MSYTPTMPETERARRRRYRRNADKVLMFMFKATIVLMLATGLIRAGAEIGHEQALKQCASGLAT